MVPCGRNGLNVYLGKTVCCFGELTLNGINVYLGKTVCCFGELTFKAPYHSCVALEKSPRQ